MDMDSAGVDANPWDASLTDGDLAWEDGTGNVYPVFAASSSDRLLDTYTLGYQELYNSVTNARYMIAVLQIDDLPSGTDGPGHASPWLAANGDTVFSSALGWYGVQAYNDGGTLRLWGYNWDSAARETGEVTAPLGEPFILEIVAGVGGDFTIAVNGVEATGATSLGIGNTTENQAFGDAYAGQSFGGRLYWAGFAAAAPSGGDRSDAVDELAWRFGVPSGGAVTPTDPGTAIADPVGGDVSARLLLWSRADQTVMDTTHPDRVRTWPDLSGYDRDWYQWVADASANTGVGVLNRGSENEPTVYVQSLTSNLLAMRGISAADRADFTFVATMENGNAGRSILIGSRTGNDSLAFGESAAGGQGVFFAAGADNVSERADVLVPPFGDMHVVLAERDGLDFAVSADDLTAPVAGTTIYPTSQALPLALSGAIRSPGAANNGSIAFYHEVRIYQGALTPSEKNAVVEYMGARYGITTTPLPTLVAPELPVGTPPAVVPPVGALVDYTNIANTFTRSTAANYWDEAAQEVYEYAAGERRLLPDGSLYVEQGKTPLSPGGFLPGQDVDFATSATGVGRTESLTLGWRAPANVYAPEAGRTSASVVVRAADASSVGASYRFALNGATNNASNKGLLEVGYRRKTLTGTTVVESTGAVFTGLAGTPDPGDPDLPAGVTFDGFHVQVETGAFSTSYFDGARGGETLEIASIPSEVASGVFSVVVSPLFDSGGLEDGQQSCFLAFDEADPALFDLVGFRMDAGEMTAFVSVDGVQQVASEALTFSAGQGITVKVSSLEGILEVAGATSGDGVYAGTPWDWSSPGTMLIGGPAASGTGNLFAFSGIIAPLFADTIEDVVPDLPDLGDLFPRSGDDYTFAPVDTHKEDALALLLEQYKGLNFDGVMCPHLEQVQELEGQIQELYAIRALPYANTFSLDRIGDLVGQPREGRDNADHLRYIQGRILANRSGGQVEDLNGILSVLLPGATFRVRNLGDQTTQVVVSDPMTTQEAQDVSAMLLDAVEASATLDFVYLETPVVVDTDFIWGAVADYPEADTAQGWGDAAGTTGGHWVQIRRN